MLTKISLASLLVTVPFGAATASSGGAWNVLFSKANGTCIGLSRMDTPEASAPVVFDDSVGKIAVLLRGQVGKGKARTKVNMICLFDKRTGKASIAEYQWLGD
ncbi:hypothetical protein [Rhizobium mesoamericanum]|uniref:Uncharacterized protein n=1 Tax=Rhizobium mesoamericanum STM3625 TaxID=1211777 RepID=K0PQJ4_9HYPH|nr:hypothetical protein [Rhizobium mesoamericanum]CCM78916.1 conserved exported hypothetical protein [Rhizobium mesoamericanum STM3625]